MFKFNNENTRTMSMAHFSTVSIADLEQVNINWINTLLVYIKHVTRNFSGQEPLGRFFKIRALR